MEQFCKPVHQLKEAEHREAAEETEGAANIRHCARKGECRRLHHAQGAPLGEVHLKSSHFSGIVLPRK